MKKSAPFLILAAGVCWGSMGTFVRFLNSRGLASMEIVFLRAAVTTLLLLIFLALFDRALLKIRLKDIWCFLGTGLCSVVFFNYCYFKAILMTSLSAAAVLLYTAPVIVMVLSRFLFQEALTARKMAAVFLTFFGCVLVTGVIENQAEISFSGILFGLGAGAGYALYSIFSRYALERGYQPLTISFYTFLTAMIGTIPFVSVAAVGERACKSGSMILLCVVFAMFSTVIPYFTYTAGLKYVENGKAAILAAVEPAVATVMGILIFHEKLTLTGILGTAFVLGGIAICNQNSVKKGAEHGKCK